MRERLEGGGGVAAALDAFSARVEHPPTAWMLLSRDEGPAAREAVARAHLAVGGATHAVARWWRDNPAMPRERVVATVMDVLWRGLERTATGAGG